MCSCIKAWEYPMYFLTNETVRLRGELAQTDDELRKIKNAAGVISLEDTQKAYAEQISKIRQDIFSAEAELAERQAMLGELTKSPGTKRGNNQCCAGNRSAPLNRLTNTRRICALLTYLEGKEQNYLTQQGFTTGKCVGQTGSRTNFIKTKRSKRNLEENYPGLVALNVSLSSPPWANQSDNKVEMKLRLI